MTSQLYFANIPYNCSDRELTEWIESHGIPVESVWLVRDLVTGISPAFAYAHLKDPVRLEAAALILNGKKMRNQIITAKVIGAPPGHARSTDSRFSVARKGA